MSDLDFGPLQDFLFMGYDVLLTNEKIRIGWKKEKIKIENMDKKN